MNCYLTCKQNKVSIADEETLVRICVSAFSNEQIQKSEKLLFDSVTTDLRRTLRKGKGKEQRALLDIISFFKVTDPDELPVFVARDLHKLPPITFDHLDVSKLLKDLTLIQTEVNIIKTSYVTAEQLDEIKKDYSKPTNVTSVSPPFSAAKINLKRGAYRDSGPIGLSHLDDSLFTSHLGENARTTESEHNLRYRSIIDKGQCEGNTVPNVCDIQTTSGCGDEDRSAVRDESSMQVIVAEPIEANEPCGRSDDCVAKNDSYAQTLKSSKEWTIVENIGRRTKNLFQGKTGMVEVDTYEKFRAADKKIPMFITNVDKNTLESDIIDYIQRKTHESIQLEKISMKRQCDHNAFKFLVSQYKMHLYLDEKLWPKGVIFRLFINFKNKRIYETAKVAYGTENKRQ